VTSRMSSGVHELLRQPGTLLITDALEMIEHVSPAGQGLAPRKSGPVRELDLFADLSRRVLDATPKLSPASAESIAFTAGLGADEVRSELSRLHETGLVVEFPDGWALAPP
jgi:DNA processing protein